MMTTTQPGASCDELLDELLAMARNLGHLEAKATAAEHRADMAPKGQTARPRREARELRKLAEAKAKLLATMRARFLTKKPPPR